ncbi:uncharacterized protein [Canis lupus baileyi]|uniref:uncharacterized protein isoform X6 n=1 Tax=Canis lupus baileyi TaxID=143281 RepID=UPI003B96F97A
MRVRLKQPLHHEDLITIEGYISHLTKEEISVQMKTDINYKRIGDTNKWQRNKSKNKQLRLHKKKSLFTVKETINKLKRPKSPSPESVSSLITPKKLRRCLKGYEDDIEMKNKLASAQRRRR